MRQGNGEGVAEVSNPIGPLRSALPLKRGKNGFYCHCVLREVVHKGFITGSGSTVHMYEVGSRTQCTDLQRAELSQPGV